MKVEMIPTVPSTAALSLGARTLAGSIACPVHLHNLAGFVVQGHGSVDLCQIVGIVLVELG